MLQANEVKKQTGLSLPIWLLNKVLAERLYDNRRYHASILDSSGISDLFTTLNKNFAAFSEQNSVNAYTQYPLRSQP